MRFKWENVYENCKWKAIVIVIFKVRGKVQGDDGGGTLRVVT